jgi:hypothetical protein
VNLPDVYINVGTPQHPDEPKTGHPTTPSLGFAMVPEEVRRDGRLTHRDLHVYMELAGARKGSNANIGERLLAKYCRIDRRGVRESVGRLVEFGHAVIGERGKRKRGFYRLTAALFSGKAVESGGNAMGANEEKGSKLAVRRELVRCPVCSTLCRQILKVGWCRKCNWKREVRKVVDERIREKSA